MRLSIPLRISYANLMAGKFRTILTMLGIVIGIAAVIIIMAVGTSAQELILDQIRGVGSNLIGVLPGASDEEGPPASALGAVITTLKFEDLKVILMGGKATHIVAGAAYVNGTDTIQSDLKDKVINFTGTNASYLEVENAEVQNGRFFTEDEDETLDRVAVLGADAVLELFGKHIDPIGKEIKIGKEKFKVIGVLKRRGSTSFSNQDLTVFVPLVTAQKLILGIDYVNFFRLKVDNEQNVAKAVAYSKNTLRRQHDIKDPTEDDFSVRDQQSGIDAISNVTNIIKYFLAAIAAISLIVGGVGIMNSMLISVNQRIREVGLRKALGAKQSTILFQFLVESAAVTLAGGVVGIVFGILVSLVAATIIQQLGYNWPFIVTPSSILLATTISILIGITFGMYPARKAARMNIVEALRYE